MRVLLTHHSPLMQPTPGALVWRWAEALASAGDDVRLLVVDARHRFGEPLAVERVVCGDDPNADLTFKVPRFSTDPDADGRPPFSSLSQVELARYRECLRRRLDIQISHFNPDVIHAQHVWVLGQLALETGVPYVLSAWPAELIDCRSDERYRTLAEQAADNAGRILAADEATRRGVIGAFESVAERTMLMPDELRLEGPGVSPEARAAASSRLRDIYRAVLEERFG